VNKGAKEAIKSSVVAASKLQTVGMAVTVTKDDGATVNTRTRSLPWPLGHGHYVVLLEGASGGYDCNRVKPQYGEAA
jgi:hypothetical protein